ncbi:unnamed protein product [Schistosoma guineensis]|nr:unnamed protein product [Schistosoma guineensis]
MKMPSNKTSWCPGLCWSIVWLLIWFLAWPMAFVLAIVEVFIIPFCVCFEKAKTACEFIDRIYKFNGDHFCSVAILEPNWFHHTCSLFGFFSISPFYICKHCYINIEISDVTYFCCIH